MRDKAKMNKFLQVFYCVIFFLFNLELNAQNPTILTEPENLPTLKNIKIQPNLNTPSLDIGQRSSVVSLTSGCRAVETSNTAAFSTAIINYNKFIIPIKNIKASWIPPAPDNPDATINGIDSDGDCVRDDIERYIGMLYKDKDQQYIRKYLFEYARWLGIFIKISYWSVETSRDIAKEQFKASECVRDIHGHSLETDKLLDRIFSNFYNTLARSKHYIANNSRLGGWSTRENIYVSCP